jgi:hypothetical protein
MDSGPAAAAPKGPSALAAAVFADHLATRHEYLTHTWQAAVDAEPELGSPEARTKPCFRLDVSRALIGLEIGLRGRKSVALAAGVDVEGWPPGYELREFVLEMGHLHRCLILELAALRAERSPPGPGAVLALQDELARLIHLAIAEGAERYHLAREKEAMRQRGDLEAQLANLTEKIHQRSASFRTSAHDLRGQLAIIMSATDFIDDPTVDSAMRAMSGVVLKRGVATLKEMLVSLIEETQSDA